MNIKSLSFYKSAVQKLPIGVVIYSLEDRQKKLLRLLVCNEAASKTLGFPLEPFIGKTINDVAPGIHRTELPAIYADVAATGEDRDLGLTEYGDSQIKKATFSSRAIGISKQCVMITFENVTERTTLEQLVRQQEDVLKELSTPLMPIADGVVVMPLIGSINTERAQQIMSTLLMGIASLRCEIAILDITGVKNVDTSVANALIQAARAANLLGAQVILTGIGPIIAQSLVGLGVNLEGLVTRGTLQSGIAYALSRSTRQPVGQRPLLQK